MASTSSDTPELIAFGGTFDPPHAGHLDAVRLVLARFPKAEICILPAAQPAGAAGVHKEASASFEQRLALCQLAFGGLARVQVLSLENELPRPNYTYATLGRLRALYPTQRLGLLIGQDQLEAFHLWRQPRVILELADLIAVARRLPGTAAEAPAPLHAAAEALAKELELHPEWTGDTARLAELGSALHLVAGELSDAASSAVRSGLARGETPPSGWLKDGVMSYIREQRLYGYRKGTKT